MFNLAVNTVTGKAGPLEKNCAYVVVVQEVSAC